MTDRPQDRPQDRPTTDRRGATTGPPTGRPEASFQISQLGKYRISRKLGVGASATV